MPAPYRVSIPPPDDGKGDWENVGVAFPLKSGKGLSVIMNTDCEFKKDDRLVVFKNEETKQTNQGRATEKKGKGKKQEKSDEEIPF